ncbi:MAG: undecaprenyl-phosphate galactose phosphotransferase WbaP [Firmicutes bacterium]|nr:undecaprenyl-phosphate galactose phosphotransferase WbaP [Bacillota bacterium]
MLGDVDSVAAQLDGLFQGQETDQRMYPLPWLTVCVLVTSDVLAVFFSGIFGFWLRNLFGGALVPSEYAQLMLLLAGFPAMYALIGLYPGFGRAPVEELRRLTLGTTLVFLIVAGSSFFFRDDMNFSRGLYIIAWLFSLVLVPLFRTGVRATFAKEAWWGEPVWVLGTREAASRVARVLKRMSGLGLKPMACLDVTLLADGETEVGEASQREVAAALGTRPRVHHLIVVQEDVPWEELVRARGNELRRFRKVTVIPEQFTLPTLGVTAQDFEGMLGIEIHNQLLRPSNQVFKRCADLLASGLLLLLLAPLFGLIAALIKIDSPGPVFYADRRIGQGGQLLMAWKFRTMIVDAEAVLAHILETDPEAAEQYRRYHKLANDPRITRVGRWLRKWSLDELPQLWNVFRGEMSVVGPRAYLMRESDDIQEAAEVILRVPPGITGLWQVSGRSNLNFNDRMRLDTYYVRNWSVWLDLYILTRTIPAVLGRRGAY